MCIYCGTDKYRKIYENHYGPIPKDETGRRYEIHHIDGNRKNNDPTNLAALTIQQHYDVHYQQKDWGACLRIAEKMRLSPEKITELARQNANSLVEQGIHPFLGGSIQRASNAKRVNDGTHNFLGGNISRETQAKRIRAGTHHFLDSEFQRQNQKKRVEAGTHPFTDKEAQKRRAQKAIKDGTHPTQLIWACPHCGKIGRNKGLYSRWHGDNCRNKTPT
jgi:hypothetical protein